MELTIPYKYQPRPYQINLFKALDSGYKRAVAIWHRRSGKDKSLINLVAKKMLERVGTYYYFFPTYSQGKKILWNGMDRDGFKFINHIPQELRKRTNDQEMLIELKNGSVFQVIGTDNIDSIVGTNPIGCVFSEYSLQNPKAWDFIRPILAENGGWAVFNYTPRGKNHGFDLYEMAKENKDWFVELLTVDDTGVISKELIQAEIDSGMEDDLVQQEFYCSFNAAIKGSYYSKQVKKAEEEGRITNVPYEPLVRVSTVWDLGVGDSTAIWFVQQVRNEIRIIDYYECSGEGLPYYAKILQDRGYVYENHYAPHDIAVKELGSGMSRLETAKGLGINFKIVKNIPIDDGINAVRNIFSKCWFDKIKCHQGLNALISYHKEYDENRKEYKNTPYHDWSSHACDAFRYLAVQLGKVPDFVEYYSRPQQKQTNPAR